MLCPALSTDLNPIDNIGEIMGVRQRKRNVNPSPKLLQLCILTEMWKSLTDLILEVFSFVCLTELKAIDKLGVGLPNIDC